MLWMSVAFIKCLHRCVCRKQNPPFLSYHPHPPSSLTLWSVHLLHGKQLTETWPRHTSAVGRLYVWTHVHVSHVQLWSLYYSIFSRRWANYIYLCAFARCLIKEALETLRQEWYGLICQRNQLQLCTRLPCWFCKIVPKLLNQMYGIWNVSFLLKHQFKEASFVQLWEHF